MSADVIRFTGVTKLDIPVPQILGQAVEADCSEIVVIGFDSDGDFYFASSKANGADVLWLLEMARLRLMRIGLGDDF